VLVVDMPSVVEVVDLLAVDDGSSTLSLSSVDTVGIGNGCFVV
jgi:hypothetical protein